MVSIHRPRISSWGRAGCDERVGYHTHTQGTQTDQRTASEDASLETTISTLQRAWLITTVSWEIMGFAVNGLNQHGHFLWAFWHLGRAEKVPSLHRMAFKRKGYGF